tara:strand:- start:496 stop:609 length:114 start_codon:yes stop_codon:yes gene_type:complete
MSDLHDEIIAWRSHLRDENAETHSQVDMPYVGEFIGE